MTINVISFYPGSGGNRLYLNLTNNSEWNNKNINYDHLPLKGANRSHKHSSQVNINSINEKYFLTHIMNYNLIKSIFPNSVIYKIYTNNFYYCLRRASRVWNNDLESIFNNIVWHNNFYKTTGVDNKSDVLFDLDNGNCDFCNFMKNELLIEDNSFDIICDFYKKNGKYGAIIDFISTLDKD